MSLCVFQKQYVEVYIQLLNIYHHTQFQLYVEQFWQKVFQTNLDSPTYYFKNCNQEVFNCGLTNLEISWQSYGELENTHFKGECKVSDASVNSILHSLIVQAKCRKEIMERVYIWHPVSESNGNAKVVAANSTT